MMCVHTPYYTSSDFYMFLSNTISWLSIAIVVFIYHIMYLYFLMMKSNLFDSLGYAGHNNNIIQGHSLTYIHLPGVTWLGSRCLVN